MADTHRLAITATGPTSAAVQLDGTDIASALTGLTLTMGSGRVPEAHLELLVLDTTELHDTEVRILIPDATRDALIALGWTPPADEPQPESTEPIEITPYLVVQHYRTDRGNWAWSWRCWGDGTCDGHLALDLSDRAYAERSARSHLDARHTTWRDALAKES